MANRNMPSLSTKDAGTHPFMQSLEREIDRAFDRFRDGSVDTFEDIFGVSDHNTRPALDAAETD